MSELEKSIAALESYAEKAQVPAGLLKIVGDIIRHARALVPEPTVVSENQLPLPNVPAPAAPAPAPQPARKTVAILLSYDPSCKRCALGLVNDDSENRMVCACVKADTVLPPTQG